MIDTYRKKDLNQISVETEALRHKAHLEENMNNTALTLNLEKIAKAYDSPPWWYDIRGFFILTFAYRSTIFEQISLFGRNMGTNHLEGAVGTGTLFYMIMLWRKILRRPDVSITAFDYADPMLDGARHRFKKWSNIKLLQADVGNLPLPSQSFDTINIANAVHCFPDIQTGMNELYRVLKPNGTMAINVLMHPKRSGFLDRISTRINTWGMKKGILHTPYYQDDILNIAEKSGFRPIYTHRRGNVLNVILTK